jgi:hypothetical protein
MNWINVKDELPPKRTKVIGYFPDGNESGEVISTAIRYSDELVSDFPNSTAYCFEATHWMLLPLPPQIN